MTERQRGRETKREGETERHRNKERRRDRETEIWRDRETEIQSRERQREGERDIYSQFVLLFNNNAFQVGLHIVKELEKSLRQRLKRQMILKKRKKERN